MRPPRTQAHGSGGNEVRPIPTTTPPTALDDSVIGPPQRRWGLIAGVLVVDLVLAVAGAWMLSEGLSGSGAPTKPTSTTGSAAVKTGQSSEPAPIDPYADPPSPRPKSTP